MSTNEPRQSVLDQAALAVQGLRNRAGLGWDILVRIDNTAESAAAPFQFDATRSTVHRRGCRAIPVGAPLYGLWHLSHDNVKHACKRCKPLPDEPNVNEPKDRADLLFGLVSLVDQFAGVLKERGRDYQSTEQGQQLSAQLGDIYRSLGRREKEVLDTVLGTLDTVIQRLRELDRSLNNNGAGGRD